jgi:hypothetical protein
MGGGLMALLDIFTLHVNQLSAGQFYTSKGALLIIILLPRVATI